jgi:hypothetical protein
MQKISTSFCLSFLGLALLVSGCAEPCVYPDVRSGKIRLVNAMVDVPKITVFINGKIFKADYDYAPLPSFGYYTSMADGSPIFVGDSLPIVITSDAAGKDTVMKKYVSLNLSRQTLVVSGRRTRKQQSDPDTRTIIRLNDEETPVDKENTIARFVQAVPDFAAIDIYFKDASVTPALITLFGSVNYGESIPHKIVPKNDGMIITEKGNFSNVIIDVPYPFVAKGLLATIVVRGAAKPIDSEPLVAPFAFTDLNFNGYTLDFETSGIRFVNGMRNQPLNLLVSNPNERVPRNNVPGQDPVLDIGPDSISKYFGLGTASFRKTFWFFSKTREGVDTVYSYFDSVYKNQRLTMVAVAGKLPTDIISHLTLIDTMSFAQAGFTRVRVVNISPDHTTIGVTLYGRTVSMSLKDVEYFTIPYGPNQITFFEGTSSDTTTLNVNQSGRPITIFILPEKAGKSYPVVVSDE